ncbi:MAG: DUF4248 domain-containing protein [Bacteroidales bacterium]|nr:DUF4248 domain-containing protein [Bacteroidales bacterium]
MEDNFTTPPFPIRTYSKQALAHCYFPLADSRSAVNRLTLWIKRCAPLSKALDDIGYNKYSKYYTSKEVALIVSYLGSP